MALVAGLVPPALRLVGTEAVGVMQEGGKFGDPPLVVFQVQVDQRQQADLPVVAGGVPVGLHMVRAGRHDNISSVRFFVLHVKGFRFQVSFTAETQPCKLFAVIGVSPDIDDPLPLRFHLQKVPAGLFQRRGTFAPGLLVDKNPGKARSAILRLGSLE